MRPAETEGGNQDLAAASDRSPDGVVKFVDRLVDRHVQPIAVSAFADQDVGRRNRRGGAQQRQPAASEVASEHHGALFVRCVGRDVDHRGTEDVPRLDERETEFRAERSRFAVVDGDALRQDLVDVGAGIERLHPRFRILPLDVEMGRVLFLNLRGLDEHDRQQVASVGRAIDRPVEPLTDQGGQVPAMVDMRMA